MARQASVGTPTGPQGAGVSGAQQEAVDPAQLQAAAQQYLLAVWLQWSQMQPAEAKKWYEQRLVLQQNALLLQQAMLASATDPGLQQQMAAQLQAVLMQMIQGQAALIAHVAALAQAAAAPKP